MQCVIGISVFTSCKGTIQYSPYIGVINHVARQENAQLRVQGNMFQDQGEDETTPTHQQQLMPAHSNLVPNCIPQPTL